MAEKLIRMEHIYKEFPGVKALRDVSFELMEGEVHALVGENGAGKSTLMKVLTGEYSKDKGKIFYRGQQVEFNSVRDSQKLGIVMIHQELNLMNHLTAAQNIFIGREAKRKFKLFLNDGEINKRASDIFKSLNVNIDPTEKVGNLTVAKQQMVEIAKALSYESKILIMDEPTASLTSGEIEDLFRVIRMLREEGKGIVYISHKLEELKHISDRITVMRDGAYIDTVPTKDADLDMIISMMVGREIFITKTQSHVKDVAPIALEVKELRRGRMVRNVSFNVRQGEILGIAGLMGAGRTETGRAIFGADKLENGDIYVYGKKININNPSDAVRNGIAYLSEDRKRYGLNLILDVEHNISIANMKKFVKAKFFINKNKAQKNASIMIDRLNIKTPSVRQIVKYLSGGNQQKIVLAKWLTRNCDILIFDEPTRGIDVGAKNEIYNLLSELASQGKAVIMISSELPEIIRICDRVVVMCEGRVTGEVKDDDIDQNVIMRLATKRESKVR
ncbi:MAG: sugar ABC transporter ATP-binding protein [Mahellales bacterium]